jgi:hypothetical protein
MLAHSRQNGSIRSAHHSPFCSHWSSRFFKAFVMRDDLQDRTELIEPWVCLGLTLSVFVLVLWLLPL